MFSYSDYHYKRRNPIVIDYHRNEYCKKKVKQLLPNIEEDEYYTQSCKYDIFKNRVYYSNYYDERGRYDLFSKCDFPPNKKILEAVYKDLRNEAVEKAEKDIIREMAIDRVESLLGANNLLIEKV